MLHHTGAKNPEAHVCELPEGRDIRCWWPDVDEKKIELSQVVNFGDARLSTNPWFRKLRLIERPLSVFLGPLSAEVKLK